MPSVSVRALITDSLMELNVLSGGDTLSAEDGAFCLGRLNQLFDSWNADKQAIYAEQFQSFTLVSGTQDYPLGPTGMWVMPVRPVTIDGANVILTTQTPNVRTPITIRDYQWYLRQPVREVSSTFPTDLYYEEAWPNGVVHLWPKPTSTYDVELMTWGSLASATIDGTFSMPQGYQTAAMLTLAEQVAPAFGRVPNPLTIQRAREARSLIFSNNAQPLRIGTRDYGMPGSGGTHQATFLYRTGLDGITGRR